MAEPNYKVMVASYGRYPHGSVIPAAVPLAHGSQPSELVRMGVLAPTHDACNCPILPDEKPALDPTASLVAERNDLLKRVDRAERNEQLLMAQVEGLQKEIQARDGSIQKLTADNGRLELKAQDLAAENAKLTKDLDAATAPAKG